MIIRLTNRLFASDENEEMRRRIICFRNIFRTRTRVYIHIRDWKRGATCCYRGGVFVVYIFSKWPLASWRRVCQQSVVTSFPSRSQFPYWSSRNPWTPFKLPGVLSRGYWPKAKKKRRVSFSHTKRFIRPFSSLFSPISSTILSSVSLLLFLLVRIMFGFISIVFFFFF